MSMTPSLRISGSVYSVMHHKIDHFDLIPTRKKYQIPEVCVAVLVVLYSGRRSKWAT